MYAVGTHAEAEALRDLVDLGPNDIVVLTGVERSRAWSRWVPGNLKQQTDNKRWHS
jgi:hypothetical protein